MTSNLDTLLTQYAQDGTRFQEQLGTFIYDHSPSVVVETGSGISTLFILKALDDLGRDGRLYSVEPDPEPACKFEVTHPRYELIRSKSTHALAPLYLRTGPWDFFLHDSDHWIECQTFEYEFAYACLRVGGHIFSDDMEWDAHFSWRTFTDRYHLKPIRVGDIEGAQKVEPKHGLLSPALAERFARETWVDARRRGAEWRRTHNRPPCWTCDDFNPDYAHFPTTTKATA